MGDKEKENKNRARVLSKRLRARVIRVNRRESTNNSGIEEFVRRARQIVRKEGNQPFDYSAMRTGTMALGLAPLRIIFELRARTIRLGNIGTWMLFLKDLGEGKVRVYTPHAGVKDLRIEEGIHTVHNFMFNNDDEAIFGSSTQEKITDSITLTKSTLLNPPQEASYEIPEEPLLKLGPIQKTPADCGPLCLYAAQFARKQG